MIIRKPRLAKCPQIASAWVELSQFRNVLALCSKEPLVIIDHHKG